MAAAETLEGPNEVVWCGQTCCQCSSKNERKLYFFKSFRNGAVTNKCAWLARKSEEVKQHLCSIENAAGDGDRRLRTGMEAVSKYLWSLPAAHRLTEGHTNWMVQSFFKTILLLLARWQFYFISVWLLITKFFVRPFRSATEYAMPLQAWAMECSTGMWYLVVYNKLTNINNSANAKYTRFSNYVRNTARSGQLCTRSSVL